jgi:hypothetical protein
MKPAHEVAVATKAIVSVAFVALPQNSHCSNSHPQARLGGESLRAGFRFNTRLVSQPGFR